MWIVDTGTQKQIMVMSVYSCIIWRDLGYEQHLPSLFLKKQITHLRNTIFLYSVSYRD